MVLLIDNSVSGNKTLEIFIKVLYVACCNETFLYLVISVIFFPFVYDVNIERLIGLSMIKFILIVKICSLMHMDCMQEFNSGVVFDNYYECATAGHIRSVTTLNNMGGDFVNRARIVIKFSCEESTDS
jgi:hypothetical protein